jgi:hypothetical protein
MSFDPGNSFTINRAPESCNYQIIKHSKSLSSKHPPTIMAIALTNLEHLMELAFEEISYCEYQRYLIPCGYVGHWDYGNSFILRYTKEEQAYLKNNYALHHEIYLYEQRMLEEVDTLRNLYEDISDDIFVKEAMEKSSLVFENNTRKPNIGGEELFSDEAFGETFDWIM